MTPILLYFVTLTILLVNTLYGGPFLNGSDIHVEAYFAQHAVSGWDASLPYQVNSCMGVTVLTPLLARYLNIDPVWALKILFPLLFSFVPVILYFIYKKYLPKTQAVIAVALFIAIPTVTMELGAITRQQLAEVFLALFFALLLMRIKPVYRYPLLAVAGAGVILSHYSLGWILLMIYLLYSLVMLFRQARLHMVVLTGLACLAVIYYGAVAGGTPLKSFTDFLPFKTHIQISGFEIGAGKSALTPTSVESTVKTYDLTMQSALGLDFGASSSLGKVFRAIQLFTEILLIIGFGYFIFRFKKLKFPFEYLILAVISALLLLVCIFVPGFSSILNATRWYHIALFILSPMFVLGGMVVLRNIKTVGALIIVYALFTTGIVFELAKIDRIDRPDLPYSVGLSDYRMNLSGHFTQKDAQVREWLKSSDCKIIYADYYGVLFLQEAIYADKEIRNLPEDMKVPVDSYIFLSEYNKSTKTISSWAGTASRRMVEIGGN